VGFGFGTGSGNADIDLTPSWGSDETFWLHAVVMSPSGARPTGVPSPYVATDVETPDPDYKETGTSSGDAVIAACTAQFAGAQEVIDEDEWLDGPNLPDLGTLIAVRGIEAT